MSALREHEKEGALSNDVVVRFDLLYPAKRMKLFLPLLFAVIFQFQKLYQLNKLMVAKHMDDYHFYATAFSPIMTNSMSSNSIPHKQIQHKPRTVLLGSGGVLFAAQSGQSVTAKEERSIEDMWLATYDWVETKYHSHYESSTFPTVLSDPSTLDGENGQDICVPTEEWQTKQYYPTCNSFHEFDFRFEPKVTNDHVMEKIGRGAHMHAWKVTKLGHNDTIVLKTLRPKKVYTPEVYHFQKVDAMSSERLTASPYVMDIFGFCGTNVWNEFGKPLKVKTIPSVRDKLRYAQNIAAGVRDTHYITNRNNNNATLAHNDLKWDNVMLSRQTGFATLNDYNQGYFLGWNSKENEPCGYRKIKRHWYNAHITPPEQLYGGVQTEKTDIYRLGAILFHLLTERQPYYFNREEFESMRDETFLGSAILYPLKELAIFELKQANLVDIEKELSRRENDWVFPKLPPEFRNSTNPAIQTMVQAIQACMQYKAKERPSARDVFLILDKALETYSEKVVT